MTNEDSSGAPKTVQPILVAVDFTPDSEAAVVWGCEYAGKIGAPIKVLHVVHDPADAPGHYRKEGEDFLQPMEDAAADMMEAFLAKLGSAHPDLAALASVDSILVKGIPYTRILEVAKQESAQLIVMGSRGLTGLPHLMLGSKAERVVQLSPIPVTIVKANGGTSS